MKLLFFSLLAAALMAAPLCGQTSPAAAAPKTSSETASTLTKEERDRAVEYLKQTQKDFLAAIQGVSEAQWKFKAAPDKWSIAETAEHIALTEQTIWDLVSGKIMKSPAAPEKAAAAKGKDETILTVIPDRSRKAQAPERLQPTGKWATQAALAKDFEALRGKEIAYMTETKEDLRNHFEEHPFLKTMDAYQWLIFNGAHCKRHTAQILEVKADPNYPKS
ncbi:MAG TPA: DinB family protein [Chthoniobacterales bacterium]|nr:DinB family protein [Chthoniobacterales bacterium]